MLRNLKDSKVVLFGAGQDGKRMLNKLLAWNITPVYFVDNNPDIAIIKYDKTGGGDAQISVKTPEVLLSEDNQSLKIIITASAPSSKEIELQINGMGLGDNIWDFSHLSETEIKAFYDDFRTNFTPKELPELRLYKPAYPFGETAVIIGLPSEKFSDFAKREDFILTSLPQFLFSGGGCAISTFQPKLDKNGVAYTFSGNAFFDGEFIFGTNDIRIDMDIKSFRENMGEFELLIIDKDKIELGNDFFGMGKWFYYRKNGVFAAATSYHLLLLLLKEARESLSVNVKFATANAGIFSWDTEQLFSEECEISGVFLLPPDKKILIKINGDIEFHNTRFFQEANFPEEYDEGRYEQLLYNAKDELIQNARAIFSHPKFKYVMIDLTDGLDTRTILAMALNLPKKLTKKIRINSLQRLHSDLRTACGIANMLELEWDNVPREIGVVPQTRGVDQSDISFNLGTYYLADHKPKIIKSVPQDTIWLNGGVGETCTALAAQIDMLMYYQEMSLDEYLNRLVAMGHWFNNDQEAKENYIKLVQREYSKVTSNKSAIVVDIFYQQFRNRLHFKNKNNQNRTSPIQSLSAYRAKKMSFQKCVSFAFQHDLIKILHPFLGIFPYIETKQTNRIKFINDNDLLYLPFGKFEILPDYCRKKYDENLSATRKEYLPNKEVFDTLLVDAKNKAEQYNWLYDSEEALLSCLKAIIDNVPEFENIGLEFFKFVINQNQSIYNMLNFRTYDPHTK